MIPLPVEWPGDEQAAVPDVPHAKQGGQDRLGSVDGWR